MQPRASLNRVKTGIALGRTGVLPAILAVAIGGSIYLAGNTVFQTDKNPNAGLVSGIRAMYTPIGVDQTSPCTATGGTTTADVTIYDTCLVSSPYNSTAATRGLRTGTGWVHSLQLDIISNPTNVSIDCTKVSGPNVSTGGTLLFNNQSGTGTTAFYSTPFTLGPTEYIKCGTFGTPASGFSARIRGVMSDSDITN